MTVVPVLGEDHNVKRVALQRSENAFDLITSAVSNVRSSQRLVDALDLPESRSQTVPTGAVLVHHISPV